jgi:hypothetical protein
MNDAPLTYATKPLRPEIRAVLERLQHGQRIRITQTVRVGIKQWPAVVTGTFRHVDSLATGLATDRVPQDDILVPIVHFTKENGELSSIAVDENTVVEAIDERPPPEPAKPPVDGPINRPARPPAEPG